MSIPACKKELCKITKADNIIFADRCNHAILASLRGLKAKGYKNVIIQDQGGWLTYPQFAKRADLEILEINTNHGIIEPKEFEKFLSHKKEENYELDRTLLLVNSLPAYSFQIDMKAVYKIAKKNKVLVINDVSGSIGLPIATMDYSDLIVGSFGPAKPVNLGVGGFFAYTDNNHNIEIPEMKKEVHFDILIEKLKDLPNRRKFLETESKKIKAELLAEHFNILLPEERGINIIVKFATEKRKETIIKFCEMKHLEFTECPRYIRVMQPAISIEVKRL